MHFLPVIFGSLFVCCIGSPVFPNKILGFYCLIADDTVSNYTSNDVWTPELYSYQMSAFNLLWLTFINPETMPLVPPAMIALSQCRDSNGCPSSKIPVIYSIGGEAYSKTTKQWPWLLNETSAINMANEVATWNTKYNVDGIDLDLEGPVGNDETIANNIVVFANQIKKINPNFIVTQPVYGDPQIKSENNIVKAGFTNGNNNELISSVGIMVYNGLYSLTFVPYYTGEPYNVPSQYILPGFGGAYPANDITQMANDVKQQNLAGFMVWFASVWDKTRNQKALSYSGNDATIFNQTTGNTWAQAIQIMNS